MAEKRRAARSAAEMAEVWRVKAAKAAQRAAKQEEKDARAKVAAESPTHKAAVDLLRYLEMILHTKDLDQINGFKNSIYQWRSDLMGNLGELLDSHPDMSKKEEDDLF